MLDFPPLRSFGNSYCKEGSLPARYKSVKAFHRPLGGWFSHRHVEKASPCLCRATFEPQGRGLGRVALRHPLVHSDQERWAAEARKLTHHICRELFLQLIDCCVLPNVLLQIGIP